MSLGNPGQKNPFGEEEEDDWGYSRSKPQNSSRYGGYGGFEEVSDDDFARPVSRQKEAQKSMDNQLAGTQRALASIYESERMGVATAEELVQQGEQLDNVEKKTDKINNEMKTTQKHLNSIKSVFGGIKTWWGSGKDKNAPPPEEEPVSQRSQRLQEAMNSVPEERPGMNAALRLRSEDGRGFYEDDDDSFGRPVGSRGGSAYGGTQKSAMQEYEDQLDSNLGLMSDGLSRLKGLGLGLADEIEVQNDQLDRIHGKVERADVKIKDQNRQMRGILGVKK